MAAAEAVLVILDSECTAGGGSLQRLVRRFNDDHAASGYVIAASFVASSDWQPTASALPALSIPA